MREKMMAACRRMRDDGWWWYDAEQSRKNAPKIKLALGLELIVARTDRLARQPCASEAARSSRAPSGKFWSGRSASNRRGQRGSTVSEIASNDCR